MKYPKCYCCEGHKEGSYNRNNIYICYSCSKEIRDAERSEMDGMKEEEIGTILKAEMNEALGII